MIQGRVQRRPILVGAQRKAARQHQEGRQAGRRPAGHVGAGPRRPPTGRQLLRVQHEEHQRDEHQQPAPHRDDGQQRQRQERQEHQHEVAREGEQRALGQPGQAMMQARAVHRQQQRKAVQQGHHVDAGRLEIRGERNPDVQGQPGDRPDNTDQRQQHESAVPAQPADDLGQEHEHAQQGHDHQRGQAGEHQDDAIHHRTPVQVEAVHQVREAIGDERQPEHGQRAAAQFHPEMAAGAEAGDQQRGVQQRRHAQRILVIQHHAAGQHPIRHTRRDQLVQAGCDRPQVRHVTEQQGQAMRPVQGPPAAGHGHSGPQSEHDQQQRAGAERLHLPGLERRQLARDQPPRAEIEQQQHQLRDDQRAQQPQRAAQGGGQQGRRRSGRVSGHGAASVARRSRFRSGRAERARRRGRCETTRRPAAADGAARSVRPRPRRRGVRH